MLTRRVFLQSLSFGSAALVGTRAFSPSQASAAELSFFTKPLTRKIPSTGEMLPVIGMGTSGSFEVGESESERAPLAEVLEHFIEGGATVIDTAPSYGSAETVLGDLVAKRNARSKLFLATKLSSSGRDAGMRQFNASLSRLRTDKVELLQVHNLQDWRTQLAFARELKEQGKTKYVGVTHYLDSAHDELVTVMKAEKPDFVQINYSVISRNAEKEILPLAQDLGIAVLINRAFEDGRLFSRVEGKPLPNWAKELEISSWAQAFLKFTISHPAVTVVIPATGKPHRQVDNLRAGFGPLLNNEQRRSLVAAVG